METHWFFSKENVPNSAVSKGYTAVIWDMVGHLILDPLKKKKKKKKKRRYKEHDLLPTP